MKKHLLLSLLAVILLIPACQDSDESVKSLPILGRREVVDNDTIYHKIADFAFVNQDSMLVTGETFKDKIYVADFFFTSCPTICPTMKTQMLRVYEAYEDDPEVGLLSHSIDPEFDTVALLKDFANRLGVKTEKWHFVTGNKEEIYKQGQTSYMVTAAEDATELGGYIHSGAFILVDKEKRIRGYYDGTKPDQVDRLISDIERLKKEYANE
jgi:protein SCO1/2